MYSNNGSDILTGSLWGWLLASLRAHRTEAEVAYDNGRFAPWRLMVWLFCAAGIIIPGIWLIGTVSAFLAA